MDFEPQYEHIDWNDIVDAELSGDHETLELLRNKSMELKRSFSLPSPTPPPLPQPSSPTSHHQKSSPRNGHFRVPRKCRKPLGQRSLSVQQNRQFDTFHSLQEQDLKLFQDLKENYPSLSPLNDRPQIVSPPQAFTYAQVATARNMKRTASERLCLSPTGVPPKRSAQSDVMTTPTDLKRQSKIFDPLENMEDVLPFTTEWVSTPCEDTSVPEEDMDMATPDNDRLVRSAIAVQRRLFPTAETNSKESKLAIMEKVDDLHRLKQRQKQIEFGKNTVGYERYIQTLPKWKRQKGDPMTPDKHDQCSTRSWQGRIRVWRRLLHAWDPPAAEGCLPFTTEDAFLCDIDVKKDV